MVVVGAHSDESLDENGVVSDAGAVYVYRRNGADWGTPTKLVAPTAEVDGGDAFGLSVAAAGDVVIVGAVFDESLDENGVVSNAGAAYAFDWPTAACQDGIDNDGDALVDLADPGCEDADDRWEREAEAVPLTAGSAVAAPHVLGGLSEVGGLDAYFPTIAADGTFRAEVIPVTAGDTSAIADPAEVDFFLPGSPGLMWDLSFEPPTSVEGSTMLFTFAYDPATLSVPEDQLRIYHWDEALLQWDQLPVLLQDLNTHTITVSTTSLSPFVLGVVRECDDGIDNDLDGAIDIEDPDCLASSDPSELPACSDGFDRDYDGWADYPEDPGCAEAVSTVEAPQCQDGANNDPGQDPDLIDFDGGESIYGACSGAPGGCPDGVSDPDDDGVADPDPQCVDKPWKKREYEGRCGLGAELAALLSGLLWLHARRLNRWTWASARHGC